METFGQVVSASLSARRAWIEIVERKIIWMDIKLSLSARRAWIEMIPLQWTT